METQELLNALIKNALSSYKEEFVMEIAELVLERIETDVGNDKSHKSNEIAAICNISISTLNRWAKDGLKYTSSGKGTQRYFTIKDVNNFKKKHK